MINLKTVYCAESLVRECSITNGNNVFVDISLGAAAFMGLGIYSYFSGHTQLQAQQAKILQSKSMFGMKSRQAGITSIAISLVGMGLWRLVN